MRWSTVAVAMALTFAVLGTARSQAALAEEGIAPSVASDFSSGIVDESAGDSEGFSVAPRRPIELVAPVGIDQMSAPQAAPEWVTPMAPLPPAILVGALGIAIAGWHSRRVKRYGV